MMRKVVVEVIRRLTLHLGADGRRGTMVIVFTGATVQLNGAIDLVRRLVIDGYRCRLAFSDAAEQIYGTTVTDQLDGFPHISRLTGNNWFGELKQSLAVVVPMLSVNTLSKISMLIADNLATNLILHALFMGKTLVMACDGVDPGGRGRADMGLTRGRPELAHAILQRLQIVESYGARLSDSGQLRDSVTGNFNKSHDEFQSHQPPVHGGDQTKPRATKYFKKMVTAADIRRAHLNHADIRVSAGTLVTPLARELAQQYRMALFSDR